LNPVRMALPVDLPRLVEIYNQAIESGRATADLVPYTEASRRVWFAEHGPDTDPIFVYDDGVVQGYLSLSPYRGRPDLRRTYGPSGGAKTATECRARRSLLTDGSWCEGWRVRFLFAIPPGMG
jgi:L-amino acid N-acyltransferase YncA